MVEAAIIADPPPVMDVILGWIGFDQVTTRDRIREEGLETFDDLSNMKEKDICDLAESYSRQTVAYGWVIFGIRQLRYMIGLIHWVQNFIRIDEHPTIEGIDRAKAF